MAESKYEIRSILDHLETFLTARGWSGIEYNDSYQADTVISNPYVSVSFAPKRIREIQIGRTDEKLYNTVVTVDAYMKTENQAKDLVDAVIEFFDLECVVIKDHTDATLGTMQVNDSETIRGEVIPPIMNVPSMLRWRGTTQARMDSWYF